MHSVLLVDDEARALSGIERTFPWRRHGFEVTARTTDPVEALELLAATRPELALVDIRMPELDGLELIRKAKERGVPTLFVLVSGHSEFEFAQEAIRQGVFDYCLKPIDPEAADRVLSRVSERLASRSHPATADPTADPVRLEQLFPAESGSFVALLASGEENESHPRAPVFSQEVRASHRFEMGELELYLVEITPELDISSEIVSRVPPGVCIGVGTTVPEAVALDRSLERAREALEAWSYYPEERLFFRTGTRHGIVDAVARELTDALDSGDPGVVEARFADLPEVLRARRFMPWELDALVLRVISELSRSSFAMGVDSDRSTEAEGRERRTIASELRGRSNGFAGFSVELRGFVLDLVEPIARRVSDLASANPRMRQLIDYVGRHIGERFTLQELASRFGLHPNYCSELFNKTTGMRFSDYVANLRMWRARQLLLRTDRTVAEIAAEVGYEYFHFNKQFKRRVGMTPREFRLQRGVS